VESDKNSEILEKQLKTLGQKIRIDILKKLHAALNPLTFSALKREVLGSNSNSVNFSFHLKALKKIKVINSSEAGYSLSSLGKEILKNILSIEQTFNNQNKTIMIRTSKYSKEPFKIRKIEEYLIKEGEMEPDLAKKIAQEVKRRLSKTNIEYLTAPLMREYINGVLLENDLEKIRHKLTRLGTPPYEALKMFTNKNLDPKFFIEKLGSDVSEQFLLLNLLPNYLSDMYLSGEITLLHLNYWALRPLSLYLNTNTLLDLIFESNSILKIKKENSKGLFTLILKFFDQLSFLKPFFSEDILLDDFNNQFLSKFDTFKIKKTSYLLNALTSQINRYNKSFSDGKPHLSLDFKSKRDTNLNDEKKSNLKIELEFLKKFNNGLNLNEINVNPSILFDYKIINSSNLENNLFLKTIFTNHRNNVIFYNQDTSNLLNSSIISVNNSRNKKFNENKLILDKIFINLHLIAIESNQNDDLFFDLIQERLNFIFEFFSYKEKLVKKKLNSIKSWNSLISRIFKEKRFEWCKNSVKSISFLGLNEAIKFHCNIELDRIERSELFALKILTLISKIIEEKNEIDDNNYILSQPHHEEYLKNSRNNGINNLSTNSRYYSSRIIRKESNLTLDKRIMLFKKFEKIIKGGCVFNSSFPDNNACFEDHLKTLFQSNLRAFSINDNIN